MSKPKGIVVCEYWNQRNLDFASIQRKCAGCNELLALSTSTAKAIENQGYKTDELICKCIKCADVSLKFQGVLPEQYAEFEKVYGKEAADYMVEQMNQLLKP